MKSFSRRALLALRRRGGRIDRVSVYRNVSELRGLCAGCR